MTLTPTTAWPITAWPITAWLAGLAVFAALLAITVLAVVGLADTPSQMVATHDSEAPIVLSCPADLSPAGRKVCLDAAPFLQM